MPHHPENPDQKSRFDPPQPESDREEPLRLAPDQEDDDDLTVFHATIKATHDSAKGEANAETKAEGSTHGSPALALRWALDAMNNPAMAAADWLARDIDPDAESAADFLCSATITMTQVRQAKTVFKTMRIVGEKSADRRIGARLYAAAIAAGLVRHGKKITTQSDTALKRAFKALLDDRRMAQPLRDLAGMALCALDDRTRGSHKHDADRGNGVNEQG